MKIVITGGGTGGHVFPALAIADELKTRGFSILYVGEANRIESKLVPGTGIPFFPVRSGAIKNQSLFRIGQTLVRVCMATLWSLKFLRAQRPNAVVGVGGYVSVPVCFAAFLLRIPIYLQEQNVSVGIANRVLGRLAKKIFLGFEQARSSFPNSRCLVTGNPLRKEFYRADFPAVDPDRVCLLILGGSQGAHSINELMVSLLEDIHRHFPDASIIHQTGDKDFDSVRSEYDKKFKGTYAIFPFISDIAAAYAKASLVISRSGALSVSEIIQVGRPAIFIPYPRQGQNDQTANAYWMEENNVARVVEQGENFKARFWKTLLQSFEPENLRKMAGNYSRLRGASALVTIGDQIERDLELKNVQ